MGFLTLTGGGIGFILIGISEAFSSPKKSNQITLILSSLLSFLTILNSLFSFIDASISNDKLGTIFQLQTLAVASLFLLHSLAAILTVPPILTDSILLFAFFEEFLLFHLRNKDPSGIENRYYDLVLVPISICLFATAMKLVSSSSSQPDSAEPARLGRAAGLVLQGMWFVQTAVSVHTDMVAHGCFVHAKSRGNFSVKCRGHVDYHRARAIATLQFNCHLAFVVIASVVVFSVYSRKFAGDGFSGVYRPINAEMRTVEKFSLGSDEDEDREIEEEEKSVEKIGLNGVYVSHM